MSFRDAQYLHPKWQFPSTRVREAGKRVAEVRLDSEWESRREEEAGWSVPVRCNNPSQRHWVKRVNRGWQHGHHIDRKNSMDCRGLHER